MNSNESSREEVAADLYQNEESNDDKARRMVAVSAGSIARMVKGGIVTPYKAAESFAKIVKENFDLHGVVPESLPNPFDAIMKFVTLDELSAPPPDREYLLTRYSGSGFVGFFPRGKVGMLIGEGGVGKTMVLAQLAIAIATCQDWLGNYSVHNGGKVLLVVAEEDRLEMLRRLYWAAEGLKGTEHKKIRDAYHALIQQNVCLVPLDGAEGIDDCAFVSTSKGVVSRTPVLEMFKEAAAKHEWCLIIVDPLSRFSSGGDENDNNAATSLIRAIETLTRLPGKPSVIVGHHTSKSGGANASGNASDSRGAKALTDGTRWCLKLSHGKTLSEDTYTVEAKLVKHNYNPGAPMVPLAKGNQGLLRPLTDSEHGEYTASEPPAMGASKKPKKTIFGYTSAPPDDDSEAWGRR